MDKNKGLYLGTDMNGCWWKRYKKNKMFARGSGEYWFDNEKFYFLRYLFTDPITIPFQQVSEIKTGKFHCGRWQWGRVAWKTGRTWGRTGSS